MHLSLLNGPEISQAAKDQRFHFTRAGIDAGFYRRSGSKRPYRSACSSPAGWKRSRSVNPYIPSNLVIDHSLQVRASGCSKARRINEQLEFDQNFERYQFLKWSQSAYDNLQILPPGLGICHQVNVEYLGQVAFIQETPDGERMIYP